MKLLVMMIKFEMTMMNSDAVFSMFITMIVQSEVRSLTKVLGVPVLATPMGKGSFFASFLFTERFELQNLT